MGYVKLCSLKIKVRVKLSLNLRTSATSMLSKVESEKNTYLVPFTFQSTIS